LGDKLRLLDLDDDGELSKDELKSAVTKILKRSSSPEEIDEFFQALDADKDGKVSVVELLRYAEEKRKHEEADTWKVSNII